MKELIKELGLTERQLKRILLHRGKKPTIVKKAITGNTFKFGVVSDTHLCSTEQKLAELHTFYHICKKEGIRHIVNAGDLLCGWGIYKGQENDVNVFGAQGQAQYVIENYPREAGITTYFITGNHDLSWWNRSGVDIGDIVAKARPDMIYLGQYQGDVELNGVKIRLIHPVGGMAYALSYRGQKIVEQIPSGKKPHVLVVGHLHTAVYYFYRNIHVLQGGAFEGQTSLLTRLGINPNIGGWTCKVRIAKDRRKSLVSFTPTWIPFF